MYPGIIASTSTKKIWIQTRWGKISAPPTKGLQKGDKIIYETNGPKTKITKIRKSNKHRKKENPLQFFDINIEGNENDTVEYWPEYDWEKWAFI